MPATASSPIDRDRRIVASRLATPAKAAARLVLLLIAWLPLSAPALDLEAPDVGLAYVPLDYRASGADAGAELILNIAGAWHVATADAEGAATFAGVAIAQTGVVAVALASGTRRFERELRVVPPWLSVLVGIVVPGTLLRVFGRRGGVR